MKEHPIPFNGEMVRAILAGRKTQTRRPIKPQPEFGYLPVLCWNDRWALATTMDRDDGHREYCDIGKCPWAIGDHLWVRETWADPVGARIAVYKADNATAYQGIKWRPSIHMPRWAARLILEVTDVRVEQVQDINGADVFREGIYYVKGGYLSPCGEFEGCLKYDVITAFRGYWDSIYAKRGVGWDANPWVWVIEFKVVSP